MEQDDEIKKEDDKTNVTIQKVTELRDILQNKGKNPHPQIRLSLFYKNLDKAETALKKHRDPDWIRYCKNALIAGAILCSGIFIGLLGLKIYTCVGYSSTKSMFFWQSAGENVVSKMNKYRKNLALSIEDVNEEEILNDDLVI